MTIKIYISAHCGNPKVKHRTSKREITYLVVADFKRTAENLLSSEHQKYRLPNYRYLSSGDGTSERLYEESRAKEGGTEKCAASSDF